MFLMITLNVYLFTELQEYMQGRIFLEISIIAILNWKKFMTVFDTIKVAKIILVPNNQYQRHI